MIVTVNTIIKQLKTNFMATKISKQYTRGRDGDLVNNTYNVVTGIKNNTTLFPNPPAALADAEKLLPDYQEALRNAAGRDRTMVIIKNDKRQKLRALLAELEAYVNDTSKGDLKVLSSSGFALTGVKAGKPMAPVGDLDVQVGQSGQAITSVKKVTGARAYMHQYTTAESPVTETNWVSIGSSDPEHTFTGLQSGVKHWFRIAAIGLNGQLAYSAPVSRFIQ
jgi:hypothetical protein